MEMDDFSRRPIIILGVNHSGTRVLVDILNILGSDGGDCNNTWRENKFFLAIHADMMEAVDAGDWTRKIFGLSYVERLRLDEEKKQAVIGRIETGLAGAYPNYATQPWHWKCPTSALFMDFWLEMYPEAYFVHIVRDPLDVAQSLISRRQFYTIRSARKFYDLMEERLSKAASAKHYLRCDYEGLAGQVHTLTEFMPFLNAAKVEEAKALIREPCWRWKANRSFKHNVWNLSVAMRVKLAKALRGPRGEMACGL